MLDHLTGSSRYRFVRVSGENGASTSEQLSGVRPTADERSKSFSFREWNALPLLHGVAVTADLCVDCVTQPKSLVPELRNIFRVSLVGWSIDSPNCFEQTERNARVDCPGHLPGGI